MIVGAMFFAYLHANGASLTLAILALSLELIYSAPRELMRAFDWMVLLIGVYEAVGLLLSGYRANSVWYMESTTLAVLCYLLVRVAIKSIQQSLVPAGLIGLGGACLAWMANIQFASNVSAMRSIGLIGVVSFRSRLITPPSYVLGEWLTILLLTLPFACTLPLWLWSRAQLRWALTVLIAPVSIVSALCLSCSRALFWSVVLFCLCFFGLASMYRVVPLKTAVLLGSGSLAVLGLVLAIENTAYPGIAQSYAGGHSSQVRSAEGRIAIWRRSLELSRAHPVWGVGSGNSPLFLNSSADHDGTVGFASRTFSLPFQLLTEKGVVGALLYAAVLLLAAWEIHHKLSNPVLAVSAKVIGCCLFAGLLAALARELTYSSLLEHTITALLVAVNLGFIATYEGAKCKSAG